MANAIANVQPLHSAAEPDYPPLSIVSPDGRADGFSVELLNAVVQAMRRTISFKTGLWSEIKQELSDGKLDVLPLVGRTPEREALFDFTVPYLRLHGAIFVRADETRIRSLADLPGKRIAVMKGDNAEEYVLRENLSNILIRTPTFEEAFRMLAAGDADAVIAQRLMGLSLLKNLGLHTIRVVGKPNQAFRQDFSFAVRKGNADLLATLNEGLAIITAKGTANKLYQKWIGAARFDAETSRTLIYMGDKAFPPFEFLDVNGRPSGFNIDLLRAISKELGINISIHLLPWREVRKKINAGELDLTCLLYSNQREQDVSFSSPLFASAQAIFARSGSFSVNTLEDLKGSRVSVQDGDLMHDIVVEQGLDVDLVVTDTPQEALRLLADGKVDFSLSSLMQGEYWINKNNWKNIQIANPNLFIADYCVAVSKDRDDLLQLINAGLAHLRQSGAYDRLYDEWLGPFTPTLLRRQIGKWLLIFGVPLALIGLLIVSWIYLLNRQVAKQTAALRTSEQRFQVAAEAGGIGVFDRDIVHNRLIWDERMHKIYGIRQEDFSGAYEAWQSRIHPEDVERVSEEVRASERGTEPFETEFRILRPDGAVRHIRASARIVQDKKGRTIRMIGTNQDITRQKQIEQRLRENEERLLARNKELERFNRAAVGRELRMVELKQEINALCRELNRKEPYDAAR